MVDPISLSQALTQFQTKTLLMTGIYLCFAVALTIYSLYLNHKQAKVHNQMKYLNENVKEINHNLKDVILLIGNKKDKL